MVVEFSGGRSLMTVGRGTSLVIKLKIVLSVGNGVQRVYLLRMSYMRRHRPKKPSCKEEKKDPAKNRTDLRLLPVTRSGVGSALLPPLDRCVYIPPQC